MDLTQILLFPVVLLIWVLALVAGTAYWVWAVMLFIASAPAKLFYRIVERRKD